MEWILIHDRKEELRILEEKMNDFLNQDNNDGDKSSLILLKGEAGIGKSFAILFKYRQQQHQR